MAGKVLGSKHAQHTGQYTFRWVVGKTTGDGEQSSVEVIANVDELPQMVGLAYNLMDTRMLVQNQRYQDFMEVSKDLPPEVRLKLNQCIDVAFGRASLKDLERVKADAQEMREEETQDDAHPEA